MLGALQSWCRVVAEPGVVTKPWMMAAEPWVVVTEPWVVTAQGGSRALGGGSRALGDDRAPQLLGHSSPWGLVAPSRVWLWAALTALTLPEGESSTDPSSCSCSWDTGVTSGCLGSPCLPSRDTGVSSG